MIGKQNQSTVKLFIKVDGKIIDSHLKIQVDVVKQVTAARYSWDPRNPDTTNKYSSQKERDPTQNKSSKDQSEKHSWKWDGTS